MFPLLQMDRRVSLTDSVKVMMMMIIDKLESVRSEGGLDGEI